MAYFPQSQIKTNLYTKGGEFILPNGREYVGYYYSTSSQTFFTGKNPNNPPNIPLTPSSLEEVNDFSPIGSNQLKSAVWFINRTVIPDSLTNNPPTLPISYFPTPTEQDYKLGEFERYFLSKTNELKFIEITKEEYLKYESQDPNVSYQLYSPFKFSWQISGNKEQVYNINFRTVEKAEQRNNIRGFKSYFKGRFDQFYK